jgi:UDP-2,3-diacylglucosamine pyrophosphatase LpxH
MLWHDPQTPLFIVSDLHLGSPFFLHEVFGRFLTALPTGSTLVLNGDVVNHPQRVLPVAHARILERLQAEAERRLVVWLAGNHDAGAVPPTGSRIRFASQLIIGTRLVVLHGHSFDHLSPWLRWGKRLLRGWVQRKQRTGPPAHLLWYAKQWPRLYHLFTAHVRRNAVRWARAHGAAAITCGHTHFAEDSRVAGVRYLNTGCWTERPPWYVAVTPEAVQLQEVLELAR